mmetsp:Transcript_15711/g.40024  ORF Transcript_15711/g.40024 Transcript_15711/m.40024 type:complete len:219 (-) Transcript_15711:664-1320(-)
MRQYALSTGRRSGSDEARRLTGPELTEPVKGPLLFKFSLSFSLSRTGAVFACVSPKSSCVEEALCSSQPPPPLCCCSTAGGAQYGCEGGLLPKYHSATAPATAALPTWSTKATSHTQPKQCARISSCSRVSWLQPGAPRVSWRSPAEMSSARPAMLYASVATIAASVSSGSTQREGTDAMAPDASRNVEIARLMWWRMQTTTVAIMRAKAPAPQAACA